MTVFSDLRSTTICKAFFLNAIVTALVVVVTITAKSLLDESNIDDKGKVKHGLSVRSVTVTFIVSVTACMLILYGYVYFIWFWGRNVDKQLSS